MPLVSCTCFAGLTEPQQVTRAPGSSRPSASRSTLRPTATHPPTVPCRFHPRHRPAPWRWFHGHPSATFAAVAHIISLFILSSTRIPPPPTLILGGAVSPDAHPLDRMFSVPDDLIRLGCCPVQGLSAFLLHARKVNLWHVPKEGSLPVPVIQTGSGTSRETRRNFFRNQPNRPMPISSVIGRFSQFSPLL